MTVCINGLRNCNLLDKPEPAIGHNYAHLKISVAPMRNEYVAVPCQKSTQGVVNLRNGSNGTVRLTGLGCSVTYL
jgi:hypothetical protein